MWRRLQRRRQRLRRRQRHVRWRQRRGYRPATPQTKRQTRVSGAIVGPASAPAPTASRHQHELLAEAGPPAMQAPAFEMHANKDAANAHQTKDTSAANGGAVGTRSFAAAFNQEIKTDLLNNQSGNKSEIPPNVIPTGLETVFSCMDITFVMRGLGGFEVITRTRKTN